MKAVALYEAAAFFYVHSLGKLHLILYLLFTNYGNVIGWLANILPTSLLSCPHESRQVPDAKPFLHHTSTEMPEIAPEAVRLCSFQSENSRDRVKIARN